MNLFDIPENKSPRLLWMEKHGITCRKVDYDHAGPVDPQDLWRARASGNKITGNGETMADAIVDLAMKLNLRLWNEQ